MVNFWPVKSKEATVDSEKFIIENVQIVCPVMMVLTYVTIGKQLCNIPYTWNYWRVEYLAIYSKIQLARFLIGGFDLFILLVLTFLA